MIFFLKKIGFFYDFYEILDKKSPKIPEQGSKIFKKFL